jgi:acetyl esterase/lipase
MVMRRVAPIALLLVVTVVAPRSVGYGQDHVLPLYDRSALSVKAGKEKVERSDIIAISNVQVPDIAVYLPSKRFATGQAVVICPGGGYWILAYDYEGTDIARYLNSIGVAGVVLKYRLPASCNCAEPWNAPLQDARRAMRLVRHNAAGWNIDPHRIGIMGFSAGGHLASALGTHFDYGDRSAKDSVERESCRPDFMILMYPVISFVDSSAHRGSHENLLGKNPDRSKLVYFSSELQVRDDTPPAFLVHAHDDSGVSVRNSILMYEALRSKGISAELHILSEGGHGFALAVSNPHVASWTESLRLWLRWLNHAQ